jgi:uncharacterized protein (TIGR02284 family)
MNKPETQGNEQQDQSRFARSDESRSVPQSPPVTPSRQQSPVSSNLEQDFWRTNYQHRPYVEPGVSYEEYAPAYRYGWEAYTTHAGMGRTFEELEPDLQSRWENYRGKSKLSWEKARHAVKDAWTHVGKGANNPTDRQWLPLLENLLQTCMDGVKGFPLAADKVSPQHAEFFRELGREREQCAEELRTEIRRRGGKGEEEGDAAGAVHRTWIAIKAALTRGEKAVIDEVERGEDAAVAAYRDALNDHNLPPDVEVVLSRHYMKIKNAHDRVAAIKHSMQ